MSKKGEAPEVPNEEGPRAFSRMLQEMADGDAHVDISQEFHELLQKLLARARYNNSKAKGAFTLTLKLAAEPNGIVAIDFDVKTKEPPKARPNSVFWTTKGGNLTPQNPKQGDLFPKAVPDGQKPVAVPDNNQDGARGV